MGDDSNNLVLELVKAQFTCSICYEVMVEPSSIDCGHTFCAYCITNWMKKKASCPLCRTHIKQNTQCKLLDEYLDKIYNQFADEKEKIQRQKFKFAWKTRMLEQRENVRKRPILLHQMKTQMIHLHQLMTKLLVPQLMTSLLVPQLMTRLLIPHLIHIGGSYCFINLQDDKRLNDSGLSPAFVIINRQPFGTLMC